MTMTEVYISDLVLLYLLFRDMCFLQILVYFNKTDSKSDFIKGVLLPNRTYTVVFSSNIHPEDASRTYDFY